jgi:hypothetical protein
VEDGEVDEGVGGHEEVGQQRRHGLEVADEDAADRNAEDLSKNVWLKDFKVLEIYLND